MKDVKKAFKRTCIIFTAGSFLFSHSGIVLAAPAYPLSIDYLIETGKRFYTQSKYSYALQEFKNVLLLDPAHQEAAKYIKLLRDREIEQAIAIEGASVAYLPVVTQEQEKEEADLFVSSASGPGFRTYLVEKPQEMISEEKALEEILKKPDSALQMPSLIPDAAKPSVDLRGNLTYELIEYHVAPTYHSLSSTFSGRAYDTDLDYSSLWKDINGVFDHDYTYLNLNKPGIYLGLFDQSVNILPLRMQYQSFTGFKLIKDGNFGSVPSKTTLAAGKMDNTVSGAAGSVKYLGNIYGAEEEFFPQEWLSYKGGLYYSQNEADLANLSGTASFPKNNLFSFSGVSLKLPHDLGISGQLGHAYYEPDNQRGSYVEDWDYRIGSEKAGRRYKIGGAYEFVGDKYTSLGNPASYQDYRGYDFYGNYKATDSWWLYSSLIRYNNNVDDDPLRVTSNNTNFYLSSQHRLRPDESVSLSFSRFISNPSGPAAGSSSKSNIYRLDYSVPFFFSLRSLFNYQYSRTDSSGTSQNYAHSPGASLFKSFGRGSSWYLSQQFIKTLYKTSQDNLNSNASFNIDYVLGPRMNLYFNSYYNRDKTDQSNATATVSASSGIKYKILPDTTLSSEYNISSYNLKTEKDRWPRNWSIMAYVSQNFNFSTPPNFGSVTGRVFRDINANGEFDADEPGVSEAVLRLDDLREALTDLEGYFKFAYVAPGRQGVHLDLASLVDEWIPNQEPFNEVKVTAKRASKADFALIKSCVIKGRVFVDDNANFLYDDTEEPLEDIGVTLMPTEQFRRTNLEGEFRITYLMPGKYTLKINTRDIPSGYELASKDQITLELAQGQQIKDINFPLRLKTTTSGNSDTE